MMKLSYRLWPLLLLAFTCTTVAANKIKQSQASNIQQTSAEKNNAHQELDVWLAEISSQAYQDIDQDGYHQNFTLTFDLC